MALPCIFPPTKVCHQRQLLAQWQMRRPLNRPRLLGPFPLYQVRVLPGLAKHIEGGHRLAVAAPGRLGPPLRDDQPDARNPVQFVGAGRFQTLERFQHEIGRAVGSVSDFLD